MFTIERPDKDSGVGIYALSMPAHPKKHKHIAEDMCKWFDETNGNFKGEFSRAFAIAHCQVANVEAPLKLFVLDNQLVNPDAKPEDKQNLTNCFFEAQAIFNAEILEAPAMIEKEVPHRKVTPVEGKKGQVEVEMVYEKKKLKNIIRVEEACMSWQHRKAKKVDRYHTIKVRYQYLKKGTFGTSVKTFEGWVEGIKAHVLQHECQHFNGKNMFYDKTT